MTASAPAQAEPRGPTKLQRRLLKIFTGVDYDEAAAASLEDLRAISRGADQLSRSVDAMGEEIRAMRKMVDETLQQPSLIEHR